MYCFHLFGNHIEFYCSEQGIMGYPRGGQIHKKKLAQISLVPIKIIFPSSQIKIRYKSETKDVKIELRQFFLKLVQTTCMHWSPRYPTIFLEL